MSPFRLWSVGLRSLSPIQLPLRVLPVLSRLFRQPMPNEPERLSEPGEFILRKAHRNHVYLQQVFSCPVGVIGHQPRGRLAVNPEGRSHFLFRLGVPAERFLDPADATTQSGCNLVVHFDSAGLLAVLNESQRISSLVGVCAQILKFLCLDQVQALQPNGACKGFNDPSRFYVKFRGWVAHPESLVGPV